MSDGLELARGWELLRLRRPKEAAAAALQHLAKAPEHTDGHLLLALARNELGWGPAAIESAQKAVQCAPDEARTHFVLATVLTGQQDCKPALASVERAIELDPEDAACFALQARLLWISGANKAALAAAKRALELDPESVDAHVVAAMTLRAVGRNPEAEATLIAGLAIDPEDPELLQLAGRDHLRRGASEVAAEHYVAALRADPNDKLARRGLLEALRARSRLYRPFLQLRLWLFDFTHSHGTWPLVALFLAITVTPRLAFHLDLRPIVFGLLLVPTSLCDVMLLAHPQGRHALFRAEKITAILVALLLAVSAAYLVVAAALADKSLLQNAAAIGTGGVFVAMVGFVVKNSRLDRGARIRITVLLILAVALVAVVWLTRTPPPTTHR